MDNKEKIIKNLFLSVGLISHLFLLACFPGNNKQSLLNYNVLLVTMDTTRADHLGLYGSSVPTSPNLDALSKEGYRFDMAISTSGLTPMAHASIMTGLNPKRHGLRVFYGPPGYTLSKENKTLAKILNSYGWHTAAFISAYTASKRYGLDQGFEVFNSGLEESIDSMDLTHQQKHEHFWYDGMISNTQRRGDATTERAIEWLNREKFPFFLWVHYFDPHDLSLVPPEKLLREFGVNYGNDRETRISMYDPEIFFMDIQIGRIIDFLKKKEIFENTIIIVMADHGQGLGQHQWMLHRLLYQEDIRIPLVIRDPGRAKGKVIKELVRNIDIFPTILEILGIEWNLKIDGKSLVGLLDGVREEPRFGYAEALNTLDTHSPQKLPEKQKDLLFSIIESKWKLIYHKNIPKNSELYDLKSDPNELVNLIKNFPEEFHRLLEILNNTGGLSIPFVGELPSEDSEALENLKSLGYIK